MKKKLLLIIICLIFSQNSFSQWSLQNSGTNVTLYSVFFVDQNLGWATGFEQQSFGKVTLTTNGGLNWYSQSINMHYPFSLFFIDENTGWIAGWATGLPPNTPLSKTTNGGISWININAPGTFSYFRSVFFINQNTGWAVGGKSCIIKTTNGGINWTIQKGSYYGYVYLESVYFIDQNKGWCVGGDRDTILTTSDGGVNWFDQSIVTSNRLLSVYFVNQNTGWCVGYNGTVLKTTNSGLNWNYQTVGNYRLTSVYFTDPDNGWISGLNNSGIIYRTSNGGSNWFVQYNGTFNIHSMCFVNQNTGWAVSSGGQIIKTTNGGGTVGIQNILSEIPSSFLLSQNYPNPFNPTTNIKFDIQKTSPTKLIVYDALGREVATLVDELLKAGSYQVDWDGSKYTSGVYFYTLQTGDFIETKKMLLLK